MIWKIAVSSLLSGMVAAVAVQSLETAPEPVPSTSEGALARLEADLRRQSLEIEKLNRRLEEVKQEKLPASTVPGSAQATPTVSQVEKIVARMIDEKAAGVTENTPTMIVQEAMRQGIAEDVQSRIRQEFRDRQVDRMKETAGSRVFDKLDLLPWQREKMDSIFTEYYAKTTQLWEDRSGNGDERRAQRDALRTERDRQAQSVLDANQFTNYQKLVEDLGGDRFGRDRDRERNRERDANDSRQNQGSEGQQPRR